MFFKQENGSNKLYLKRNLLKVLLALLLLSTLLMSSGRIMAAETLTGRASYTPWSGSWWPLSRGNLIIGYNNIHRHPSPAEKYDLYVSGKYPGTATRTGRDGEWYDPDAAAWMGFCNGWVNASILVRPEPVPSSSRGVFFSVGDKKGLLAACHVDDYIVHEFCQKSPVPFHRYLLKYVGEQQGVIGADLDSTGEFWSYPIYAYEMEIDKGSDSDYVVCTITFADDHVDEDYVGTKFQSRTYHYRLNKSEDGSYRGSGEWVQGDEYGLHPQLVWIPIGVNQAKLFVDYDKISEFVGAVDDELEGEDLVPGHHLLVVYPGESDRFTIDPQIGEKISCQIALDPQSPAANGASYRVLKNGTVIQEGVLDGDLEDFTIASEKGSDSFALEIEPLNENRTGVCVHLYVDVDANFVSWFYGLPAESYWLGSAAVSEGSEENARTWVEIIDSQGQPSGRGGFSGLQMNGYGRWLNVVENLQTMDYFRDGAQPVAVKLVSNQPCQSLFLAGNNAKLWGGVGNDYLTGTPGKLAVPWLTSSFDMQKSVTLYLVNNNQDQVDVDISYYRKDGEPVASVTDYGLAPKSVNQYKKGSYPELSGVDGWAIVDSGEIAIAGQVELVEGFDRADQLPLLSFSEYALVPHPVNGFGWSSRLGICNPQDGPLELSMQAYLDGAPVPLKHVVEIGPFAKSEIELNGAHFGLSEAQLNRSWIAIASDYEFAAYQRILYEDKAAASIPLSLSQEKSSSRRLSQLALDAGWWTGVVLINQGPEKITLNFSILNENGGIEQTKVVNLDAYAKFTESIVSFFDEVAVADMATLHIEGEGVEKVKALAVYGGYDVNHLSMQLW